MRPPVDPTSPGRDGIWTVERALAAPPFGSIRVGPLVNDLLFRVANGRSASPVADTLRLAADVVRRGSGDTESGSTPLRGRILVTLVDDSARIANLVLPVLDELGEDAVVLPARPGLSGIVTGPAATVQDHELGVDDRAAWFRLFRRAAPSWARSLGVLVRQGLLPRDALPGLAHLLVVQSRRTLRYQRAFAHDPPAGVLVEYDRGTFAAPIVAAARSCGIPTATMVHGSVQPHGYTPLVADRAFCWGETQMAQLEAAGAPPDCLTITGCQRLGLETWTRATARADLGVDDRPLILLATNNLLEPAERLRLARMAFEAVATLGDTVQMGIRLHPRETTDDYRELIDSRADLRLLTVDQVTGDQVLAACDLVICGISAFADEATVAGVPAMIVDLSNSGTVTVGLGAAGPVASNRAELAELLTSWAADGATRAALHDLTASRGRQLCAATGRDAARRVADEMRAITATGVGSAPPLEHPVLPPADPARPVV